MCAWYNKVFSKVACKIIRDFVLNIIFPYLALIIATIIAVYGLIAQPLNLIPPDKASWYFSVLAISLFFLNVTFITKFLNQMSVITHENEPYEKYRETFIPDENYDENGDLYYLYKDGLPYKLKENLVNELVMMLKSLKHHSITRQLMPDQSFRMSIPLIKTLRKGDKIIAVDFLSAEEWDDKKSESWRRYIFANETAADQGASVKRIFVIDYEQIKHNNESIEEWLCKEEVKKEKPILQRHNNDPNGKDKMIGYFISKTDYNALCIEDPQIPATIGDGFILLSIADDKKKIAILDDFPGGQHSPIVSGGENVLEYRTKVTFSDEITEGLMESYSILSEAKKTDEQTGKKYNICRPLFDFMNSKH